MYDAEILPRSATIFLFMAPVRLLPALPLHYAPLPAAIISQCNARAEAERKEVVPATKEAPKSDKTKSQNKSSGGAKAVSRQISSMPPSPCILQFLMVAMPVQPAETSKSAPKGSESGKVTNNSAPASGKAATKAAPAPAATSNGKASAPAPAPAAKPAPAPAPVAAPVAKAKGGNKPQAAPAPAPAPAPVKKGVRDDSDDLFSHIGKPQPSPVVVAEKPKAAAPAAPKPAKTTAHVSGPATSGDDFDSGDWKVVSAKKVRKERGEEPILGQA
jgi:hypothetical protein